MMVRLSFAVQLGCAQSRREGEMRGVGTTPVWGAVAEIPSFKHFQKSLRI